MYHNTCFVLQVERGLVRLVGFRGTWEAPEVSFHHVMSLGQEEIDRLLMQELETWIEKDNSHVDRYMNLPYTVKAVVVSDMYFPNGVL